MPTYEYECEKCGNKFEKFQNMTNEPLKDCPACGGKVDRLIGIGGGIIFRGSGFYQTDYKNESNTKGNKPCPSATTDACKSCPLDKKKNG